MISKKMGPQVPPLREEPAAQAFLCLGCVKHCFVYMCCYALPSPKPPGALLLPW